MTDRPASAASAIVPVTRYSSAAQRPEHRYQAWREGSPLSVGRLYDTTPAAPFAVQTMATQLGQIGFSHSRMSAQSWARTPAHIRADAADPLMVVIRLAGQSWGDADGRRFDAPAGSVALTDLTRAQSFVSDASATAVLALPRSVAEETLPDVRSLHGLVIAPGPATLLKTHASALVRTLDAGLPARQAAGLGQIALDLLAVGIAQSTGGPVSRQAAATGVRLAAEHTIERTLASDALTIDNLVRWVGVSRATLYRAFDADGGVQAFIQRRRLHAIAATLREGNRSSLADLAERWGFREVSHMSRVFRELFGQPPGDYRAWHHLLRAELAHQP